MKGDQNELVAYGDRSGILDSGSRSWGGKMGGSMKIDPSRIRLEASTLCQLNCPSCPRTSGKVGKKIGNVRQWIAEV